MAEQEQMAVSEDLDARVDDILQHLEKNGRGSRHHYSFRRAAILAAACLVLASATVTASGMYQARMESMNHEKLEEYFASRESGFPVMEMIGTFMWSTIGMKRSSSSV